MSKSPLFLLVLIPVSLFAITIPGVPSLPRIGTGSNYYFGGKISKVENCFCPTEPQNFGTKWISYDPFWQGGTKTTKSLMFKKLGVGASKFYANGKTDVSIWHLGQYKDDAPSCKYVTKEDWVEALYPVPHPPKCSGKYQADGTILFTGTGEQGLTTISIPGL